MLFVFLIACLFPLEIHSYCWGAGQNPGFTGLPNVEQLSLDRVRIIWSDIVSQRECADNFVVKYWQRSSPSAYDVTDLISKEANSVEIKVTPKVMYQFQVVAREDKGLIGGVDWNKSPTVDFQTATNNNYQVKKVEKTENRVESLVRDEVKYWNLKAIYLKCTLNHTCTEYESKDI